MARDISDKSMHTHGSCTVFQLQAYNWSIALVISAGEQYNQQGILNCFCYWQCYHHVQYRFLVLSSIIYQQFAIDQLTDWKKYKRANKIRRAWSETQSINWVTNQFENLWSNKDYQLSNKSIRKLPIEWKHINQKIINWSHFSI